MDSCVNLRGQLGTHLKFAVVSGFRFCLHRHFCSDSGRLRILHTQDTLIVRAARPGPFSVLCTPKRDRAREGSSDCRNLVTFLPDRHSGSERRDSKYAGMSIPLEPLVANNQKSLLRLLYNISNYSGRRLQWHPRGLTKLSLYPQLFDYIGDQLGHAKKLPQ